MADLATLKSRLAEAEEALHLLMLGQQEVSVGYGDKQVAYSRADLPRLEAYVRNLEDQIARREGTGGRRPILVEF
ncbi:MAG: hypothetical protein C4525_03110 [Desulfarculus sp.]|nr:MAG: hypothetical protein C4525_03110 [Desulfarculus sp.]